MEGTNEEWVGWDSRDRKRPVGKNQKGIFSRIRSLHPGSSAGVFRWWIAHSE